MLILKYYFFIFLYLISFTLQIEATEKIHYTIAIDPDYVPFTQRDIEGNPTGLLVDFWDMWAKENGYIVDYKFYTWDETLLATQSGAVDFHSGTTKDEEWMYASDPIYELSTALFVTNTSTISSLRDFANKRIGTIDTYYGELVQNVVGETLEVIKYEDYAPLVEALKVGKIDALIEDVEAIRHYLITSGQINKFKKIETKQLQFINTIYAVTNKKNSICIPTINEGLKKLDLLKLVRLEELWLPTIDGAYYNSKLSEKIELTLKEKKWISNQEYLTITGSPSWKREESTKNIHYRGISGDYIQKFSQKIHNKIKVSPIDSWAELLATPSKDAPDIVLGTMNDDVKKLLEDKYTFLTPYEVGPLVMITDKNIRFITDLYDIEDKRVGVLSLQNYTEGIEYKYSDYIFVHMHTIETLLDKLVSDELGTVILPLGDAILALSDIRYKSLDIVGKMEKYHYVSIGIAKHKKLLNSIFNKITKTTSLLKKKRYYLSGHKN